MNYIFLLIRLFTLSALIACLCPVQASTAPTPHQQTVTRITQAIGQGFAELDQGQHEIAMTTAKQTEQLAQQALAALPDTPADKTRQKMQAELDFALSMVYQLQGQVYWQQGLGLQMESEHAKAEPLLKQGLELAQKSLTLTQSSAPLLGINVATAPLMVSGQMLALAEAYQQQGRHNQAAPLLEQSRRILADLPGQLPDSWSTQADLARLYRQQGNPAQAETLLTEIIHKLPADHAGVATALKYLGQLYQSQGKYPQAVQSYQQSLEKSPNQPVAALPLASLYMEQADYRQAEPLLTAALAELATPAAEGSSEFGQQLQPTLLAAAINMQGRNQTQLGNYTAATASFQQNLNNPLNLLPPANPGSKASSLSGLAKVHGLQKDIPAALPLLQQARQHYADHPAADREYASGKQQLARLHLWLLQRGLAWQQTPADTALPDAFLALQQAHGTGRTEALRQTALRLTATNPATREQLQHLWKQQSRLQQLDQHYAETLASPAAANSETLTAIQQAMQQTSKTLQQLEEELQTSFPAYAQLVSPTPLPLAQAQALLQPDEALLAWTLGEGNNNDHSWLFLLRPGHAPKLYPLDVNPTALQASLTDPASGQLSAMSNPQQPFNLATAHALYRQLLAPAEADLAGVKHILAVPDGVLHNLPLHMLLKTPPADSPAGQHGDYAQADWLARHYAVSYLPSVHALADLRGHPAAATADKQPFTGFGDPLLTGKAADVTALFQQLGDNLQRGDDGLDFFVDTNPLGQTLQRLPETASELTTIAQTLQAEPDTALFLAKDATESRLKQMSHAGSLRRSHILSFATHALLPPANQDNPLIARLEPGLILTPPPQGSAADDGYLSASEIAGLELDADWVLLSACNTGTLAKQDAPNGLSALSKAFFTAGAHSVLASHWAVESQATSQLMKELFVTLQRNKGMRRAEALRQTMLARLATPAECGLWCWLGWQEALQPAHPAYWAAFVIYGEGGEG